MKCPWNHRYGCKTGSVIQNARKRHNNSESHAHIVRDLLIGLEKRNHSTQSLDPVHVTEGDHMYNRSGYDDDPVRQLDDAL